MRQRDQGALHVRTREKSFQLPLPPALRHGKATDAAIARFAEEALGLDRHSLDDHAVDRSERAVVIRPWASWG